MPRIDGSRILERFCHAIAVTIESPPVIGAYKFFAVNRAERQRRATMWAMIMEDGRTTGLVPPDSELFSEALDARRLVAELVRLQDRIPVVGQAEFQTFRHFPA